MKRLLFIPLLLLALSGYGQIIRANSFYVAPTVAVTPPLVVTDAFGTEYNPLWTDTDWNQGIGLLRTGSGYVWSNQTDPSLAYYDGTFDADQYSEIIINDVPDDGFKIGCAVRVSSNNGYGLIVDANDYILFEIVGGSYNAIASGAGTFAATNEIELRITGTTLKMYLNDVQFGGDQTDNSLSTGSPGVAGAGNDALTGATSFEGGEL